MNYLKPVAASLLLLWCAVSSALSEEGVTKVGFISILTGPYSDVGQAMANAATLAVEDVNTEAKKEVVKLIVEDDGADPKKALAAYHKVRELDKARLILPVSTFAIGALRERVNRQKDLTFILGNEPYEPEDDYIYMFSPAAIPAERGLGEHARSKHPEGPIFVVASQNEAFFRFARAAQEGAGARAEIIDIPAGLTDFGSVALRIKSKRPSAIIFNGFPLDTARLLKELNRIGFLPALYFDESIANSLTDLKTVLSDLSILKSASILTLTAHTDPSFVSRYEKRFGTAPKIWTDYAYDAVTLALKLRGKTSDEARAWLKDNAYQGVSGTIRFDERGLRIAEYSVIPLPSHQNFADALR